VIIDDYIVLGSSYIYKSKKYGDVRCTAGYSPTMGFIRIYPVDGKSHLFKMWNTLRFNAEKPNHSKDWRHESWKITNGYPISLVKQLTKKEKIKLMNSFKPSCPHIFNKKKISIGIVKPKILKYKVIDGKPRVIFRCLPRCSSKNIHKVQILDWGAYEWIRKNPDEPDKIFENYHFGEDDWEHYFLMGNGVYQPSSFMVISVIRYKKGDNECLINI